MLFCISIPSISTFPFSADNNPNTKSANVVLPSPEGPIKAIELF